MLDTERGCRWSSHGAEAGGSRVRGEGVGRVTRPRDTGARNGGGGNREVHDTSRHGCLDARIYPDVRALHLSFVNANNNLCRVGIALVMWGSI
jgi:hypothetical protein